MHSPVNWALLGLVIERPSYAYELARRFERTYEGALSLSSVSHVYTALGDAARAGLIEEPPGTHAAVRSKRRYQATGDGLCEHARMAGRSGRRGARRQRVLIAQLGALARTPSARSAPSTPTSGHASPRWPPPAAPAATRARARRALVARLIGEETRLTIARAGSLGAVRARAAADARAPARTRSSRGRYAMSLLALEHVSKRYRDGQRERIVLDDVDARGGETENWSWSTASGAPGARRCCVSPRGSRRPTPAASTSRAATSPSTASGARPGHRLCRKTLRGSEEQGVLEQVAAPLLARGVPRRQGAGDRSRRARTRRCAGLRPPLRVGELSAGETMRVALARTLALVPGPDRDRRARRRGRALRARRDPRAAANARRRRHGGAREHRRARASWRARTAR